MWPHSAASFKHGKIWTNFLYSSIVCSDLSLHDWVVSFWVSHVSNQTQINSTLTSSECSLYVISLRKFPTLVTEMIYPHRACGLFTVVRFYWIRLKFKIIVTGGKTQHLLIASSSLYIAEAQKRSYITELCDSHLFGKHHHQEAQ